MCCEVAISLNDHNWCPGIMCFRQKNQRPKQTVNYVKVFASLHEKKSAIQLGIEKGMMAPLSGY